MSEIRVAVVPGDGIGVDVTAQAVRVLEATAASSGRRVRLTLDVFDPWKGNPVKKFSVVHEKLFHAFIVSRDLSFFVHDHPEWNGTSFTYDITFPRAGMYRVLGDFYPEASTPQLIAQTVFVPGDEYPIPPLTRDTRSSRRKPERGVTNTRGAGRGETTQLRFTLGPADGCRSTRRVGHC